MMAQGGKNGAAASSATPAASPQRPAPPVVPADRDAGEPTESRGQAGAAEQVLDDDDMDEICETVERDPAAFGGDAGRVRRLCQARRRSLATEGKKALPPRPRAARPNGESGLSGRDAARQHRDSLCRTGRGNAPACRPTGRVRPRPGQAPQKVEIGTTLRGGSVTGTQVERAQRVTGSESGSCRNITGTEYIGAEQYEKFCDARPEGNAPKVGVSATSHGRWVTGTAVGRAERVTGDEPGTCKSVTGTEYFGAEQSEQYCEQPVPKHPSKVSVGATQRRGMPVSGSDEFRANRTTGTEAGMQRQITGSQYSDAGVARMTINGSPSKVALSHTFAGRSVSGTEVGRSVKVTGDEAGECRTVSGTEYLSNEQFQTICRTQPAQSPAKVGVDQSRRGQQITGNLVDRSEKVTGNEPGSCQRVTGAQYGQSKLCGGGVDKVQQMRTMAGGALTGTGVDHRPKMTGDERGGCLPVTGTEYYGQEQYREYCEGTPVAAAAKVGVSQTGRGQFVSGTMVGHAEGVTGDEACEDCEITGTPYAAVQAARNGGGSHAAAEAVVPRYLNPADRRAAALTRSRPAVDADIQPAADFSVVSPQREARSRITGNDAGGGGRVTGPVNKAMGLITGTPEFRSRDEAFGLAAPMSAIASPMSAAQRQSVVAAEKSEKAEKAKKVEQQSGDEQQPARITGEGREGGRAITGDDWARGGRITGTEGRWAQGRNPTQRGDARGAGASAWANRNIDRPELPQGRITGSSGNTSSGPGVTYSGGARG
jgi:Carboxysome shell peptide mid-region.